MRISDKLLMLSVTGALFYASNLYALTEYGCEVTPAGGILSAAQIAPGATNRVLVIVCAVSNGPAPAIVGQITGVIFTNQVSADLTVRDSSFSKLGLKGAVIGVITNNNLRPSQLQNDTGKLALEDYCKPIVESQYGVAFSNYQSVIFMMPASGGGPAGKTGYDAEGYAKVFIDGDYWNQLCVTTHEYGHTLGMDHSGITIDNSSVNLHLAAGADHPTYGDSGCLMGHPLAGNRQYNVLHKYEVGWIPSNNVMNVVTTGTYTVYCSELATNQTQIMRIGDSTYASYRAPLAKTLDTNLVSNYLNATMVYRWDGTHLTHLYAALTNGATFADFSTTSLVQQVSCDGTSAVVRVTFPQGHSLPVAHSQSVTNLEDTSLPITLSGWSDTDGANLKYLIVANPAHGALNKNGALGTYKPDTNYNGTDSFTFQTQDSLGFLSALATVLITVKPVSDPPTAGNVSDTVEQNVPKQITLAGSDPDGDPITYLIVRVPSNGVVTGAAPQVTYTPASGYFGNDSFTYQVVDTGGLTSPVATVSLTVAGALVLHLPLDQSLNGKAPDLSGNGFSGVFKNMSSTNFVSGKAGNALNFDGANDYVEVPDAPLLRIGNQHTLSAWIKPDNTNNFRQIIGKGAYSYNMAIFSGKIRYILYNGITISQVDSVSTVPTGVWTHVACTYDGAQAKIYINGLLNKQVSWSLTPTQLTAVIQIGSGGGSSYYFKGQMDEVRLYQRALSANELSLIAPSQTYSSWSLQNAALLGGLTNKDDDSGGLGLNNLGRYAFGGVATNGPEAARLVLVPTETPSLFSFRLAYNARACDLAYYVEQKQSLVEPTAWSCILSNITAGGWTGLATWRASVDTNGVGLLEVTHPINTPSSGFFRTRVEAR